MLFFSIRGNMWNGTVAAILGSGIIYKADT